ncbi:MAG: hypothetical protein JO060_06325 [Candidatus Eremiobacteraeota bacterium]|nr:hypothetical protein [Candidatus Eremiobacteraeota bacterium]MBV9646608.1 hypothetical protein [Candidatus Eremiobacteraeota bacterium]
MKLNAILGGVVLGTLAAFGPTCLAALAQEQPPAPPPAAPPMGTPAENANEPNCGSWETGTWVPNGSCGATDYRGRITGTITEVKGHLVTIQQTKGTLVINDQPALDQRTTGRVAVGRQVVAVGYWRNGVFYATRLV